MKRKGNWKDLFIQVIKDSWILPAATIVVFFLWSRPHILLLAICLFSALVILQGKHRKKELHIFIAVGLTGPIAEMIAIWGGAWSYTIPLFLGVPLWLFPLWGVAGIFIYRNAKTLKIV